MRPSSFFDDADLDAAVGGRHRFQVPAIPARLAFARTVSWFMTACTIRLPRSSRVAVKALEACSGLEPGATQGPLI